MKKAGLLVLIWLMPALVFTGCGKTEKVITSFNDAKNARIGVMTGLGGEAIAAARFPRAQVKRFCQIPSILSRVLLCWTGLTGFAGLIT
jgi:polar amino acid transport system substrate-binding protein